MSSSVSSAPPASVPPEDQIETPNENDVLCGRGGSINSHTGNERFRKLVEARKRVYLTARFKREKRLIASSIVSEIRQLSPPGRFLAKRGPKGGGYWYDIGDEKARDKTSQALRENAPSIRAEIESEVNQRRKKEGKEIKKIHTAPTVASSSGGGSSVSSASHNTAVASSASAGGVGGAPVSSPPPAAPPSAYGSAPPPGAAPPPQGYYSPHAAAAWADYYARYARYYGHYPPHPPPGAHQQYPVAGAPYPTHHPGHHPPPHHHHHHYPPPPPQSYHHGVYGGPPPPSSSASWQQQQQPQQQQQGMSASASHASADEHDGDRKPAAVAAAGVAAPSPLPSGGMEQQQHDSGKWSTSSVAHAASRADGDDNMDDASDYSSDAHEFDVDDEVEKAASLSPRRQQEEQDRRLALSLYHQEQVEALEERRRRHDAGPKSRKTSRSSAFAPPMQTTGYYAAAPATETYAPLAAPAPAAQPRQPKTQQELRDHRLAVELQDKEDQALSRQRQKSEHSSRRTFVSSAYSQVHRHHLDTSTTAAGSSTRRGSDAEEGEQQPLVMREDSDSGVIVEQQLQQAGVASTSAPGSSIFTQVTNHIMGSLGSWDPNTIMCSNDGPEYFQPTSAASSRDERHRPSAPAPAPQQPSMSMALEPEGHEVQLMDDVREEERTPRPSPAPTSRQRQWGGGSWEENTERSRRSLFDPASVSIFHSTNNAHHEGGVNRDPEEDTSIHSRLNSTIGSFGDSSGGTSGGGRIRSSTSAAAYFARQQQQQQQEQFQNYYDSPANSMDMTMDGSAGIQSVSGNSLMNIFDRDLSAGSGFHHHFHPRIIQQVPSWERSMRSKSPSLMYQQPNPNEDNLDEEDDSHMIHIRSAMPMPATTTTTSNVSSSKRRHRFRDTDEDDDDIEEADDSIMDWESDEMNASPREPE